MKVFQCFTKVFLAIDKKYFSVLIKVFLVIYKKYLSLLQKVFLVIEKKYFSVLQKVFLVCKTGRTFSTSSCPPPHSPSQTSISCNNGKSFSKKNTKKNFEFNEKCSIIPKRRKKMERVPRRKNSYKL